MKISRPLSKKRWLIIASTVLIIVVALGVGAVYALQNSHKPQTTTGTERSGTSVNDREVDLSAPSEQEIKAGEDTKAQTVNSDTTANSSTQPGTLDVTAFYTGTYIQVRSTINASIQEGSCSLTLTKGDQTITKDNVGIQSLSGYSACKGWDIPASELSSGSWNIKVTVQYQSKTTTGSASVTIP
jgi:hypothetical protein